MALVRFNDGTVLWGCYSGTVDILSPWLITREDLINKWNRDIFAFDDHMFETNAYIDKETIDDSEPCEIYIDYGYGDVWVNCSASRSKMYVTSNTDCTYAESLEYIPQWVHDYFVQEGFDTQYINDRVLVEISINSQKMLEDMLYGETK